MMSSTNSLSPEILHEAMACLESLKCKTESSIQPSSCHARYFPVDINEGDKTEEICKNSAPLSTVEIEVMEEELDLMKYVDTIGLVIDLDGLLDQEDLSFDSGQQHITDYSLKADSSSGISEICPNYPISEGEPEGAKNDIHQALKGSPHSFPPLFDENFYTHESLPPRKVEQHSTIDKCIEEKQDVSDSSCCFVSTQVLPTSTLKAAKKMEDGDEKEYAIRHRQKISGLDRKFPCNTIDTAGNLSEQQVG